jgi:uncharacterized damage-inducible protein DinB
MNTEVLKIVALLQDAYNGDPWFGRSVKSLLAEVKEDVVFEKPNEQHSILELLWHMILWREFIINSFSKDQKSAEYFEENDWRILDHADVTLWANGLQRLDETQTQLIETVLLQQDPILEMQVPGRNYNFKKMLYGIIAHDIYHVAQVAYVNKMLQNK